MSQNLERLKELPERHQDLASKVEQLTASFSRLQTTERVFDAVEDNLGGIIRAELREMLVPTLQMCLDQYSSRYDGQLKALHIAIDKITLEFQATAATQSEGVQDIGTELGAESEFDDTEGDLPENRRSFALPKQSVGAAASYISDVSEPRDLEQESLQWEVIPLRRVVVKQKKWQFKWLGSSLRVTIKTLAIGTTRILSRRRVEISVQFLPSPSIISRSGISMLFSTGPDHRGYHAICPSIRVFRVISENSPALIAIFRGDIPALQVLFAKGEARPSDQMKWGISLLHVSLTQALTFSALAEMAKLVYLVCSFLPRGRGLLFSDQPRGRLPGRGRVEPP
jgi:hypothetical protein